MKVFFLLSLALLVLPTRGVGRQLVHATTSAPAPSPNKPPPPRPVGSILFGLTLFFVACAFAIYYPISVYLASRPAGGRRPRVLIREPRVLAGVPTVETAVMATLRAAEAAVKEIIVAASSLIEVVDARDREAEALAALVAAGGEPPEVEQVEVKFTQYPAIYRDANRLDVFVEGLIDFYEYIRNTDTTGMRVLRWLVQAYEHCSQVFSAILRPGVVFYLGLRMFWPGLTVMDKNAPRWSATWVPI